MEKVETNSSRNHCCHNLASISRFVDSQISRRSSVVSLDFSGDDSSDISYRRHCDELGAELARLHIIQMDEFSYSSYFINGFSVQLSMIASDASALAVTRAKNARNQMHSACENYQIYSDDVCVDTLKADMSEGSTAIFLGTSLPCFGANHKFSQGWGGDKLVAVVFRDVFDQIAA